MRSRKTSRTPTPYYPTSGRGEDQPPLPSHRDFPFTTESPLPSSRFPFFTSNKAVFPN